MSPVDVK
jgi:DNA repair protein RadC